MEPLQTVFENKDRLCKRNYKVNCVILCFQLFKYLFFFISPDNYYSTIIIVFVDRNWFYIISEPVFVVVPTFFLQKQRQCFELLYDWFLIICDQLALCRCTDFKLSKNVCLKKQSDMTEHGY